MTSKLEITTLNTGTVPTDPMGNAQLTSESAGSQWGRQQTHEDHLQSYGYWGEADRLTPVNGIDDSTCWWSETFVVFFAIHLKVIKVESQVKEVCFLIWPGFDMRPTDEGLA